MEAGFSCRAIFGVCADIFIFGEIFTSAEKSSIIEFSSKVTLEFSQNLSEKIGNGFLVIELETNLGEDVGLTSAVFCRH